MTWWMLLSGALALLLILMALGVPLFAAFLVMNVTGVLVLFGPAGFRVVRKQHLHDGHDQCPCRGTTLHRHGRDHVPIGDDGGAV